MIAKEPAVPVLVPGHPYEKTPVGSTGRPDACSESPSPRGGATSRVAGIAPVRPVRGRPSAPRSHAPDVEGPALRAIGAAFGTRPRGIAAPRPGRLTETGAW